MCMIMHLMHGMDHSGHAAHAAPTSAGQNESLPDILKRRYALGETTRQQFEEMKHTLGVVEASSANAYAHH